MVYTMCLMKYNVLFLLILSIFASTLAAPRYRPRNGDILFQTSESNQSQAIQLATKSPYSHVGIVFIRDDKPFVLEAIEPVQFTPMNQWIRRGVKSRYVAKRLIAADSILSPASVAALTKAGKSFFGKKYDACFQWSDSTMYCSELVWKVFQRSIGIELGQPGKLRDFDLSSPIVNAALHERFGDEIPYDETVIAPSAIFDSELLTTVYENK